MYIYIYELNYRYREFKLPISGVRSPSSPPAPYDSALNLSFKRRLAGENACKAKTECFQRPLYRTQTNALT